MNFDNKVAIYEELKYQFKCIDNKRNFSLNYCKFAVNLYNLLFV